MASHVRFLVPVVVWCFLTSRYDSWAMGNLGRAGYGASLDGMWPYTYDACDVGTVANQTKNGLPVT